MPHPVLKAGKLKSEGQFPYSVLKNRVQDLHVLTLRIQTESLVESYPLPGKKYIYCYSASAFYCGEIISESVTELFTLFFFNENQYIFRAKVRYSNFSLDSWLKLFC